MYPVAKVYKYYNVFVHVHRTSHRANTTITKQTCKFELLTVSFLCSQLLHCVLVQITPSSSFVNIVISCIGISVQIVSTNSEKRISGDRETQLRHSKTPFFDIKLRPSPLPSLNGPHKEKKPESHNFFFVLSFFYCKIFFSWKF